MNCRRCQQVLKEDASFCDRCGLSITSLEALTELDSDRVITEVLLSAGPPYGRVLDAKYQLIALLGEGGMGAVYRARRVALGDEVAIKILQQQFVRDEIAAERFRREARAAAALHHPNVVAIYDFGEARGEDAPAYIVMELVTGATLRELLRREGKLDPERAVALMRDACAGVGAAHQRNIIHRDLKPDNVIVIPPDGVYQETVKVVDFGIAKLRDLSSEHTLTETGVPIGTPRYMSPEQCRGEALDARSDVYSLGAMLYEMFAGVPPFAAATSTGVLMKHLTEAPPPLPQDLGISPALEAAVMRALAKHPDARQRDAMALALELQTAFAPTIAQSPAPATAAGSAHVSPAQTTAASVSAAAFDQPQARGKGWLARRSLALLGVLLLIISSLIIYGLRSFRDRAQTGNRNVTAATGGKDTNPSDTAPASVLNSDNVFPPAPEINLWTLEHEPFHLSGLRGRVVLLNFWSTKCQPCNAQIPDLNVLQRELGARGLSVIGVTWSDAIIGVQQFQLKVKQDYIVLVGGKKEERKSFDGFIGPPVSYLIDRAGRIRQKHLGPHDPLFMRAAVEKLLDEAPAADVEAHKQSKTANLAGIAVPLTVQIRALSERVWIRTSLDNKDAAAGWLESDETREFQPAQRLKIEFAADKATSLKVSIDGRPARLPVETKNQLTEVIITNDNYQQFLP